jgi:hypothetical protein
MQVQGIGESLVLGECLHLYIKEKTTLVQDYCFNTTFNNISNISWLLFLLMEKSRVPEENHWPAASH